MIIVAGTYEGFCYGWESAAIAGINGAAPDSTSALESKSSEHALRPGSADAATQPLSLVFGYNVHVGCMKSVAMATSGTRAGQLLVTGGADERVRIYDLRDRTELGELQQHNGTITCMEFYKSTHLLTGSEDHSVCIWRVHDWALLHVLGGHKAAVTSLSIHPSGRMALSVSRDRTLRLWNLLEGRCAYIKRLQGEGELVRWSPSGDSYLIVVGNAVVVYSAATSEPLGECKHDARVNSACFVGGDGGGEGAAGAAVATCSDDKNIRFFKTEGGSLLGQLDVSDVCPTGRVRDMRHVAAAADGDGDGGGVESGGSLVAVTSAGVVNVWGVPSLGGDGAGGGAVALDVPLLATHSVKGEPRFTCVAGCLGVEASSPDPQAVANGNKNSKKRKQHPQQRSQQQGAVEGGGTPGGGAGGHHGDVPGAAAGSGKKKKSKRKKAREGLQSAGGGGGGGGGGAGRKGIAGSTDGRQEGKNSLAEEAGSSPKKTSGAGLRDGASKVKNKARKPKAGVGGAGSPQHVVGKRGQGGGGKKGGNKKAR